MINQGSEVWDEGCWAAIVRVQRKAPGAMVERDAAIARRESGNLLPPADVVAARSVREDHGNALPMLFVVQSNSIDVSRWQVSALPH